MPRLTTWLSQRIPNLDELCGSNRLTSLLATDLEERRNSRPTGKQKATFNNVALSRKKKR
jgi:hypothetical protein